jgi:hypothetical protein
VRLFDSRNTAHALLDRLSYQHYRVRVPRRSHKLGAQIDSPEPSIEPEAKPHGLEAGLEIFVVS